MTELETLRRDPRLADAIDAFVADVFEIARHIVHDPTNYGWPPKMGALAEAIVARECPDPDVLAAVAGYVCVVLPWKATYRRGLTVDEQHVLATARRLYDGITGARDAH